MKQERITVDMQKVFWRERTKEEEILALGFLYQKKENQNEKVKILQQIRELKNSV